MAYRIIVQDGNVLYAKSDYTDGVDPLTLMDFSVSGVVNVTHRVNVGNNPLVDGLIHTPDGSGVNLILRTYDDGVDFGNIKFEPVTGGRVILNGVAWPDGTVAPVPGMYLGVSALNTLQFYTLPTPAPKYQLLVASAAQTVFNTSVSTIANGSGQGYLQIFVNGVKQIEGASKNYQVTGINQVTFNTGLTLNDDVEFYGFV